MPRRLPPSFDFFPDDFVTGTMHLHPFCIGLYMRLLCFQWSHGRIPALGREMQQVTGATSDELAEHLDAVLEKFPPNEKGDRLNVRLEMERLKKLSISDRRANSARARWNSKQSGLPASDMDANAYANGYANDDAKNMQREVGSWKLEDGSNTEGRGAGKPKKKPSVSKPEDVSESVWVEWIQHRKLKSAAVSETVVSRLRSEADKAGWSLEDVMKESMLRGWTGFKAEWAVSSGGGTNGKVNKATKF